MSALWTAQEAAQATGGKARGAWRATGLSIDTRTLAPGDLFIALTDRRDGHDFVADALAGGAAAAMVSRVPDGLSATAPLLLVDDVMDGLRSLGQAGRDRTRARVIAVTGSVGKTSTKEMLRLALGAQGRVHAAEKSYNNHWGVPLTLARCPADADFAVIEIGMNAPGEIAPLASLAAPDVAMVTIVAPAHLGAFDDVAGIAREKAAIFGGLKPGGVAVLNGDLEWTAILRSAAGMVGARILSFGEGVGHDAVLEDVALGAAETRIEARIGGRPVEMRLGVAGRHFALNALAALLAVDAAGGDMPAAARAMSAWQPPAGRGTRETLDLPGGAIELIDDAYNANPASVAAGLTALAEGPKPAGRRVAVLGDMLELGPSEMACHVALADLAAMRVIDRVHCAGPRMRALWDALPDDKRGLWDETAETLAARAGDLAEPGDAVLVKGSLSSRLGLVVAALRERAAAQEGAG